MKRWLLPGVVICVAAAAVIAALVAAFILPKEEAAAAAECGSGQTAASVDLASIPDGPIAGVGKAGLIVAAKIMIAGQQAGMSARDQQIGVAVAMGESDLGQNPAARRPNGDGDVGPFQQRALVGWYADGRTVDDNVARLTNPSTAATTFFTGHDVGVAASGAAGAVGYHIKGLKDVSGRNQMSPSAAAHAVQGNADPNFYSRYWSRAVQVAKALSNVKTAKGQAVAATSAPTTSSKYPLGSGIQPNAAQVANSVGPMFKIKTVGGWRPGTDKYDQNGHPAGLALDFMINDIPNDVQTGQRLADYLKANAAKLSVKYIIYRQHIWSVARASEGWRAMEDRGSPTENHMDHVHLSLERGGKVGSVPAAGDSGGSAACPPVDTKTKTVAASSQGWARPGTGPVTSGYGGSRGHTGIDFGQACGTPIVAANSGTVTYSGHHPSGYYNLIAIQGTDKVTTRYAHMADGNLFVKVGDKVTAGQKIALTGSEGKSTGCHLHFEVMNPQWTDPRPFLISHGVKL